MITIRLKVVDNTKGKHSIGVKSLEISPDTLVKDFKNNILEPAGIDPSDVLLKVIYKGKVLNDERLISDYGVNDKDTFVILLAFSKKKKLAIVKEESTPEKKTETPPSDRTNSSNRTFAPRLRPQPTPTPNIPPFNPLNFGQGDMQSRRNMLSQMMQNPMFQSLFEDPKFLKSMMENNPAIKNLIDKNPHMKHVLNNPEILKRQMEILKNPEMLNEVMRQQDLQLSQLENVPGGFAAMRSIYEQMSDPGIVTNANEEDDVDEDDENAPRDESNPWGSNETPNSGAASSSSGNDAPSNNGIADLASLMNANLAGFSNPAAGGIQTGQGQGFPGLDPAALSQMDPATLGRMMTNMGNMLQTMGGAGNNSANNTNGSNINPLAQPNLMESLRAMNQMLPMNDIANRSNASNPNLPPEERYSSQLEQLEQMGFPHRPSNLSALIASNGNIDLAIDMLLRNAN